MLKKAFAFALFFLFFSNLVLALDAPYDHSLFDQFLKDYVTSDGNFDYAAAKKDPHLLNDYLAKVENLAWDDFQSWPREERMALLMNLYQAGLIRMVLSHYPIKSLQQIPGFWQMDTVRIGDKHFGLNGLRKENLIRAYRDEKIHMALSYGARSGPQFSPEAFRGPALDAQLLKAANRFVNDSEKNKIQPGKKKIYLSKIFEWHNLDFTLDYGAFENEKNISQRDFAVLSFVAHYLQDDDKIQYLEDGNYKIKYLPFSWALNDKTQAPAPSGQHSSKE